jgi:methyl-accepting chemotaxis protein
VALAGETMEKVVSSVQHVTDIMAEISSASAEASAGIEQSTRPSSRWTT